MNEGLGTGYPPPEERRRAASIRRSIVKGIDVHIVFHDGSKLDLKGARQAGMEAGFYNLVWAHDDGEVINIRRFYADDIKTIEETLVDLRPESHLVVPKLAP